MPTNKKLIVQIRQHVANHCGWALTSADHRRIGLTLQTMAAQQSLNEQELYSELLKSNNLPGQLVDSLVIPETYFFRYAQSYKYLRNLATRWLSENETGIFRVASIPGATGEEPYSIAMILLDSGIPLNRLSVDAIDLSQPLIEKARRGVYSTRCLDRQPLVAQDRYFELVENGLRVKPEIRERVNFMQGNVKSLPASFFGTGYPVIFCRNLLIYLSDEVRTALSKQLKRMLKANGTLFVGPAEVGYFLQHGMVTTKESQVFSLQFEGQRAETNTLLSGSVGPKIQSSISPDLFPLIKSSRNLTGVPSVKNTLLNNKPLQKLIKKTTESQSTKLDWMTDIRQLADAGDFKEAYRMSEIWLNKNKSVSVLTLQAELLVSMDKVPESIQVIKKALYIEPENEAALSQLVQLFRRQGDLKQAVHYQQSLNEVRGLA